MDKTATQGRANFALYNFSIKVIYALNLYKRLSENLLISKAQGDSSGFVYSNDRR